MNWFVLLTACGGLYTASPGTIFSPYFPNAYPHERTCEYVITAGDNQVVTLTFTFFDIEGHETCAYDYLEVRELTLASLFVDFEDKIQFL